MNFFKNMVSQERCLRGESDPSKALNDAFLPTDEGNEFSDLETLFDKYCFPKASTEGEAWDSFKLGFTKVKEGTGKFIKGLIRAGSATADTVKKIGSRIGDFISTMTNSIKDKVVTEKYIHEKFDKITKAISTARNVRCYVENVPEYDTLIKRLNGIIACANYIKQLSTREDAPDSRIIMEQLEVKSKGVVKVVEKNKESSFVDLEWKQADLSSFDIKSSKYANQKDLDTLKNLILHCKYEATDDLIATAKEIDKRSKEEQEDESISAGNYALVYSVGKVTKQFYKEAIQKEINMIATVYCQRLSKFVDK